MENIRYNKKDLMECIQFKQNFLWLIKKRKKTTLDIIDGLRTQKIINASFYPIKLEERLKSKHNILIIKVWNIMKTIGIILARKGSKGLKNKNRLKINGKSLVEITIDNAKKVNFWMILFFK